MHIKSPFFSFEDQASQEGGMENPSYESSADRQEHVERGTVNLEAASGDLEL